MPPTVFTATSELVAEANIIYKYDKNVYNKEANGYFIISTQFNNWIPNSFITLFDGLD